MEGCSGKRPALRDFVPGVLDATRTWTWCSYRGCLDALGADGVHALQIDTLFTISVQQHEPVPNTEPATCVLYFLGQGFLLRLSKDVLTMRLALTRAFSGLACTPC